VPKTIKIQTKLENYQNYTGIKVFKSRSLIISQFITFSTAMGNQGEIDLNKRICGVKELKQNIST